MAQSKQMEADWLLEFPPPRSLPLDQEALRVFERAHQIGNQVELNPAEPAITFSTLLLALLTAEDETSRWFQRVASSYGPFIDLVCQEKSTDLVAVQATVKTVSSGRPSPPRLSSDKQLLTISARAVLETAEEWAQRVGGSDIGVRHLVATYVVNPPAAHRRQMSEWKFRERDWRPQFFAWVAERYTAEAWTDSSNKAAPTKAVAAFEQQKVKGEELLFPSDEHSGLVLRRAAQYHARRSDSWLRLQTVFYGLVDVAREHAASAASAVEPIVDAIRALGPRYLEARDIYLNPVSAQKPFVEFDSLDISPRVLNGLETARELARAGNYGGDDVGILQLAGALISRRVDGDEELAALGLDPRALRLALIAHATAHGASSEIWREALGEEEGIAGGRPVDLNSDEPEAVVRADANWTNDPLAIRPDVESFAALLASKSLEPPLSIGLFGPWGSGKTTFLKRLRRTIEQRATKARAARDKSEATPYVSNVVHVEFNAWHFAEDALISSLLDTIVRELRAYIKNDYPLIGKALEALKSETVVKSRGKLEKAKAAEASARDAVKNAAHELAEQQAKARQEVANFQSALKAVWAATRNALMTSPVVQESGLLEKLSGTVKDVDDLRAQLNVLRNRPARLLTDLGWGRTVLFGVLVLAVPPAIVWLVQRIVNLDPVGQSFTLVSGLLSTIALWLRSATGSVAKIDQAVAKVVKEYETQLHDHEGVKTAQQGLQQATDAASTAAATLASAERDLASAEADAAAASLPAQMAQLAGRRIDDRTYAKDLTTISVAREDLYDLSKLLRDQSADGQGGAAKLRAVDRVILYIDDLDRCRPEDVVRVLQVVHMLLAFELFVVVVAVDARWVEESLRQNYKWLAGGPVPANGNGAHPNQNNANAGAERLDPDRALVTPQDYLEKIFQISFWLAPLTSARAAEFLKSLVRTLPRQDGPVAEPSVPPTGSGAAASVGGEESKIEIASIELDYMRALAAYVGPSPRRVKRLVNAYRLLKARLSDAQLRAFLTDRSIEGGGLRSGPYQLVIGLLVIGTGVPVSASQILTELAELDPKDELDVVITAFRERNHPDWNTAARVLETLMRTQKAKDVSEIRGWARSVGRFLLQGPASTVRATSASEH